MQLEDNLYELITELSEMGDEYLDEGEFDQALAMYAKAFSLLPQPAIEWEAATWLLVAIGETRFFKGDYEDALRALKQALLAPEGLGHPLVHLRLGEVYYEMGEIEKARDELARAYMAGGVEIFEDEDRKYFALVKSSLKLSEEDAVQ